MNDHTTPAQQPRRQSPSPADLLGPRATLAAQEKGYAAALAGQDALSCPWKSPATEREAAMRDMWIRGHAAGRTDLRAARHR